MNKKKGQPRIPEGEFHSRVANTRKKMEIEGLDYLVAFSSYPEREGHLGYLTNYHGAFPPSQHDEIYRGLGYGALIIGKDEGPVLFPGVLFASGRLVGVEKVVTSEDIGLSLSKYFSESVRSSARPSPKIGLVGSDVFPRLYAEEMIHNVRNKVHGAKFVNSDNIILDQRQVKSSEEQAVLREAARIADAGIIAAFNCPTAGAKEYDLGIAAARTCYEEGADYVARTRIYGAGISGVRWPIMTNRKLERGEITGTDLVGSYNGYGFDVLRMWTVGRPSPSQSEMLHDAALLTEETTRRTKAGMTGDEISNATLEISKELRLKGEPSPFGHAIGLEIVESPILLPKSNVKISSGAILCIEPGLEVGQGKNKQAIHFEDEVLVGANGSSVSISKCTKDFT